MSHYILLTNPWASLVWCWEHGYWPGWLSLFRLIGSVFVCLITWSPHDHALTMLTEKIMMANPFRDGAKPEAVRVSRYWHRWLGRICCMTPGDFPPGYLQICTVIVLGDLYSHQAERIKEWMEQVDQVCANPLAVLLTPFYRLLHWMGWRDPRCLHETPWQLNCAALAYLAYDPTNAAGIPLAGMYPKDFLLLGQEVELTSSPYFVELGHGIKLKTRKS